ncbi:glyoxalase [Pontibacillus chungwhensis BH030062]|uniref:Glyoxalase n=1 Tax=Pontibacillus chungwhensis BH030062 TaxID=1385513 RepID=A0A0A2UYM3_9BACI|nr:VOC family protein [Pontibacillus chungwhensis]KGP91838.1 glyoxalase [Pontibacillus chungwhensis BH030062]
MNHPILNEIGTVFIPVKNIEKARDWYCDILGLAADGDILFGHLYILPMKSTGIVLDSKIYSDEKVYKMAPFHLNTTDIQKTYSYMKEKKVTVTSEIQHDHFFTFQDPDGNHLMVCQC